ncbi:MAG: GrpB family protein, partial [Anaerolineae bacterium]|nr:GrpB family protein [Anaerolineae bacterium]
GYEYVPEYNEFIPERRYFHKGPPEARTFHLHMVELASEFWERHLLFRDWLRSHPEDAQEYDELKRGLADRFGRDREGYTEAKGPFIEAVVVRARATTGRVI